MSRKEEDFERLEAELATARNELQFMASTEKGNLRAVNAKLLEALERARAQAIGVIRSLEDWPGSDPHHSMKRIEPTFGRIVEIKACITSLHDIETQARAAIEEARK
jgi:hypothetical protein